MENNKIGIKIILTLIIMVFSTMGYKEVSAKEVTIDREFTIDVNKPKDVLDKQGNLSDEANNPKLENLENSSGPISKEEEKMREEIYIPKENPYEPTKPSQARGTIIESIGADNKDYPKREEILDVIEGTNSNQAGSRPKADAREFLTFQTDSGKVFHLIINHDEPDANVQLVTEVSEQDLLNMIMVDEEKNGVENPKDKEEKIIKKEESEEELEEGNDNESKDKDESKGSFLFIIIGVVLFGGAAYYFKFIKTKDNSFDEFEDDEIPDEDSFFSDNNEEEYNKEDLL